MINTIGSNPGYRVESDDENEEQGLDEEQNEEQNLNEEEDANLRYAVSCLSFKCKSLLIFMIY